METSKTCGTQPEIKRRFEKRLGGGAAQAGQARKRAALNTGASQVRFMRISGMWPGQPWRLTGVQTASRFGSFALS